MNIAVVGGGAAGMMAASVAQGHVTLFEKNERLGKKVFISGKGRCNITTSKDVAEFFDNVVTNEKFLYSALYALPPDKTAELFEHAGVALKVERGDRIFPKSDKSSDIIKAYEKRLRDNHVALKLNTPVKTIEKYGDTFYVNGQAFERVIIATGGLSYQSTGSTGDGYLFAKALGHTIVETVPALVPILLKDSVKALQGLSLKNVELTAYENRREIYRAFGEMVFTDCGISGPIVLSTSSYINRRKNITLTLDLKPALDRETLDRRLLRDFEAGKNKDLTNALSRLLLKSLIDPILHAAQLDGRKKVHDITKAERDNLVRIIKAWPLHYDGLMNINAGIVTGGGVCVKDIDPSTMASKLVQGLYFAGEVMDVDGLTGGFNLQIANSTGYLAGISAGRVKG
ncbi:aminoacetone oxidase family FAD-binding enzyme [Peptoniphilus equinus]|uniref:Aminoacetone oxidase family FAD-binding enzyme n=1 Tax=Peptoniphilus equinus TaxID=3016343 RepID=A0ABY7QVZ8_9FIRM|nr:aminoacetone oxidase family FAD-binding enzyme [Peptoniphilus equinus]WBW50606.1 aminoacetone oxidase family FAD-binding enzyme [Peptoniphilus equinus]